MLLLIQTVDQGMDDIGGSAAVVSGQLTVAP
jgi:hypothetical protein